jgi:hypothetical protein
MPDAPDEIDRKGSWYHFIELAHEIFHKFNIASSLGLEMRPPV